MGSGTSQPRTCEICGTVFYVQPAILLRKHNTGRFCSNTCKGVAYSLRAKKPVKKTCPICGRGFEVPYWRRRTIYCSLACAHRRAKRPPCLWCGEPVRAAGRKYCSTECYWTHAKGSESPHWKGGKRVKRLCENCGQPFEAYRPDVQKGMGRYCSQDCWISFRSRHASDSAYSHTRGGKRLDLDNRYFRSAWEANWARYLNWLKEQGSILAWEYEPETFEFEGIKRGSRFYTPDFCIKNANGSVEYHEVKGWMDQKSKTKLKRMAKYHPEIKIIVIDNKAYGAVARQVQGFIPNWETGTWRRLKSAQSG